MKKGNILVVDDNKNVLTALRILLQSYFERVTLLDSPKQLHATLAEVSPDVVLLDMNFSAGLNTGNEGLFWLSEIKKLDADLPVVLFTAYADIELAVEALKRGACDFVVKPWDNAKLVATLQAAYSLRQSRKEVEKLKGKQDALNHELNKHTICWGTSQAMADLHALVEKVAGTDANILLTGENGTGKELIAREIHRLSLRNREVLITVDMGAITETLFESELFGYTKGAFTDAKTDRAGKFEAANGGTLFLDEIGNLSYPMQAKLLTALRDDIARKLDDWKQVAYYQEQERLYKDVYNEQKQREQIVLAQQGQEFMQWKRLMQEHQIKVYVFVGSFILLIILFIVRFVFRNRRKYEQIRHEMSATLSVHELTQSQVVKTNVVDSGSGNIYTEEIFQYFQIEIRHTDIYKKVERIILFQKNNPGKKGPETFDSDDKTAFINEVDRLLPGYIFRLRSRFVLLDERDILLLCLYLAGFSVPQIGIVFERHRDSIYKYIRRIKKEKMLILDEKDINEILHHVE